MPTLESLDRRLRVGEELRSVVSTMKGLAAVSIHEYERAVRALSEYNTTVELGLQILFRDRLADVPTTPPPRGRVAGIVVGTDQGLCGPMNREIAHCARRWFEEHRVKPGQRLVAVLGRRASRELARLGLAPHEELGLPGSVETIGPAVEDLLELIGAWQASGEVGRTMLFYQHPVRRTQRSPRVLQLAPLDTDRLTTIARRDWPTRMLPGFPHSRADLLLGLLRHDLFISLYRAIAEAKAAEHGARLVAMQAAEQNIEERVTSLRSQYNRLRQAEITEQLLDVVSGFEALAGTDRR